MPWILMFIGSVLGLAVDQSFVALLLGAIFGLLLGHSIRIHSLKNDNKRLKNEVSELKAQTKQDYQYISSQIITINKLLTRGKQTTYKAEQATTSETPTTQQQSFTTPQQAPTNTATAREPIVPIATTNIEALPPEQTAITDKVPLTPHHNDGVTTKNATDTVEKDIHYSQPNKIASVKSIDTPIIKPAQPAIARPATTPPKAIPPKKPVQFVAQADHGDTVEKLFNIARNWLLGGNTILKVGAIILFLGLAFLLRYATEGMVIPISVRYIGVAIGGLVLIGLGWRLRTTQYNYGLILQGTGVAILYLTCYAAMYLHQLLTPNNVFFILIIITIASALLAILQDSLSLAAAAALGGFAAPILASSGGGSHVALFSYFILLNAGILTIAWFKTWRLLNLIGFTGTFGIGFSWGLQSYTAELFWSTQPFLIIFFLMYIAIGLLFARRKLYDAEHAPDERKALLKWSIQQTDYIDATVVFGTPIVGIGLQYALVSHIPYGFAISSLILGIFYLLQAFMFYRSGSKRISLLTETCLALGVVFSSLSIPLALDAKWTSASWALEGAGIYWVSLRQHRKIGRMFALLLQLGATLAYLTELGMGNQSLLAGSSLGALMLGISLLFSYYQATKQPAQLTINETTLLNLFGLAGITFLYLIPTFYFMQQGTAISWAIAGAITIGIGLKYRYYSAVHYGLIIQLLAGFIFIFGINLQQLGSANNADWYQLVSCIGFGLILLGNILLLAKNEDNILNQLLLYKINIVSLVGLIYINLAILFVLPWSIAASIWPISGVLSIIIALRFKLHLPFYFGLGLQLIAGLVFVIKDNPTTAQLAPFYHSNFWTPLILSIAALFASWRIQRITSEQMDTEQTVPYSILLLIWAGCWWGFAFSWEILRVTSINRQPTCLLLATAISLLVAGLVAKRVNWYDLACSTALLIPISFIVYFSYDLPYPLNNLGWLAWGGVFAVHFFTLKRLDDLLADNILAICHIIGIWLLIAVLTCTLQQCFNRFTVNRDAWQYIIWIIVPSSWLLFISIKKPLAWPMASFIREYRFVASLPMAIVIFFWFWLVNIYSDGTITSIPYIPLLNPLELSLLLALASCICWFNKNCDELNIDGPTGRRISQITLGLSLFALSTAMVFRTAFHWAGVPFNFEQQLHSMIVQASLSILWTSIALTLMIVGHRKIYRELWLVGASLITVVVVKLFFVELGNSGSLARIVSFTIVGVLLLIVGYFAPLPPKQQDAQLTE